LREHRRNEKMESGIHVLGAIRDTSNSPKLTPLARHPSLGGNHPSLIGLAVPRGPSRGKGDKLPHLAVLTLADSKTVSTASKWGILFFSIFFCKAGNPLDGPVCNCFWGNSFSPGEQDPATIQPRLPGAVSPRLLEKGKNATTNRACFRFACCRRQRQVYSSAMEAPYERVPFTRG
jgi:hypothetical protein